MATAVISSWLFPSIVRVLRPNPVMVDGVLTTTWQVVPGMERIPCRLEVNFYRPGRDMPLPPQAGRAPDRLAVYWVAPSTRLLPGDHLECVSGPVSGTWQIRTLPDVAQNMRTLHHLEGQAVEVHSSLTNVS